MFPLAPVGQSGSQKTELGVSVRAIRNPARASRAGPGGSGCRADARSVAAAAGNRRTATALYVEILAGYFHFANKEDLQVLIRRERPAVAGWGGACPGPNRNGAFQHSLSAASASVTL
jgi:hypothetical protein